MTKDLHRFIVHDLDHALAVLDQGAPSAPGRIVIESPPGTALRQGIGWFQAIEVECRQRHPEADCHFLIDCDDAAALALAALRLGCRHLRVRLEGRILEAVRDVAAQFGAELETTPAPALDLGAFSDPRGAIAAQFARTDGTAR